MSEFLAITFCWLILFLLIAIVQTFYYGYRSPVDWWYCCIDRRRDRGVWYYGSVEAARRREKSYNGSTR